MDTKFSLSLEKLKKLRKKVWSLSEGSVIVKSANTDMRISFRNGIVHVHMKNRPIGRIDLNKGLIFDAKGKEMGSYKFPTMPLVGMEGFPVNVGFDVMMHGKKVCETTQFPGTIKYLMNLTRLPIFKIFDQKISRNDRALIFALYLSINAISMQQAGRT